MVTLACYSVLKDFAGPVATIFAATVAACVAAYFARQQWKTAQQQADTAMDQLRFNLFEKRYAVYDAIRQLMALTVNQPTLPDFDQRFQRHSFVVDEAKFFFSSVTCEWLEIVRADCKALRVADEKRADANGGRLRVPRQDQPDTDLAAKVEQHFHATAARFRSELSFRQLT
jgi:hypothetical protein